MRRRTEKEYTTRRCRRNPPPPLLRRLVQLPDGLMLPDGRVLTFEAHRLCPCADCRDAFAALDAGLLDFGMGAGE